MNDHSLNSYLDEIGRQQALTADDEVRLSLRIRQGDERALHRLVSANLKLVVAIAKHYAGDGLSLDDLVSEGNLGLLRAAAKYDGTRGLRFAGYASAYIRRQMERALDVERARQGLAPSGAGQADARQRQAPPVRVRSVDAPLAHRSGMSLLSVLSDASSPDADARVYSGHAEQAVEQALQSLAGREAQVIAACFGLDCPRLTMAEIAADMGLKRERVRQIRDRALRRLRSAYRKRLRELAET